MIGRLGVPTREGRWRLTAYPLAAVVLVGLGLGQVLSSPSTPRLWLTVLGVLVSAGAVAALPVALLPSVLVVVATDVVLQLAAGSPPFATFLATMIGVYALARHGSRKELAIGLGALAAGIGAMATSQIRSGADTAFGLVIISVYLGVVAALGWFTRQRAAYTQLVLERADALGRERDQVAALAAAAERNRLARELHDVISHGVSLMVLQAEAACEVLEVDPAKSAAGLDAISEVGRRAIADLRHLLGLLAYTEEPQASPPDLDLAGLVGSLRDTGLTVDLQEVGRSDEISEPVRSTIYRVVQESLTNVVKHAHASRVRVAVEHRSTGTTIDITDDGTTGPPPAQASGAGYGLAGMSRRVTDIGGTFRAGSLPEGGFAVHAHIPPRPVS